MSARNFIEQVAALPLPERTRFEQLFQAMKTGRSDFDESKPSNWPDFGERLRGIYGDKVMPDSQSLIDEGRGEL